MMNKKFSISIFCILFLFLFTVPVSANTLIKRGTKFAYPWDDVTPNDYTYTIADNSQNIIFNLKNSGFVVMEFRVSLVNTKASTLNEKFRVLLVDSDGKKYANDVYRTGDWCENGEVGQTYYLINYADEEMPKGEYCYRFFNLGTHDLKFRYKIFYYPDFAESITFPSKSFAVEAGEYTRLLLLPFPNETSIHRVTIKSSKPDIAHTWIDEGRLIVYGDKPGSTRLTFKTSYGRSSSIVIRVTSATKPHFLYNNYYCNRGDSIFNDFYGKSGSIRWSSSNKKIATVNRNGVVKAVSIGSCKIYAVNAGKKYSYNLIVERLNPNFTARITTYNTRKNCFIVKVKNNGAFPLRIKSGIKVEDDDYTYYDRQVYLKKGVTIPSGKSATLTFYVRGSVTWYDYHDFTLFYNFTYDGATYEGHVWSSDSSYKTGGKWYTTYWM